MTYQNCYKKALSVAYLDQYVQPTKNGCLVLSKAMTDVGWKTYHYADKFIRLDGTVVVLGED
jgi:hypothetical protein